MKAPGRLRRPSYFHAVAGGGGTGGGVSGRVLEALVAHQQQGKLAHSALGEVPVMIPAPPYICLQLQSTVETLRLTVQCPGNKLGLSAAGFSIIASSQGLWLVLN